MIQNIFDAVFKISVFMALERWFGRKYVLGFVLLILVLILIGILNSRTTSQEAAEEIIDFSPTTVTTATVAELMGQVSGETVLVGTVTAKSQAQLVAERGGRVTSVSVGLGDRVQAGQVIATFENASERASVLQAQGAYEATLANARQSTSGVEDANTGLVQARNNAVLQFNSAYGIANQTFTNTLDQYYGNPLSTIPGIRISGFNNTSFLNNERVAFVGILNQWQVRSSSISVNDASLISELQDAISTLNRLVALTDVFISILPIQRTGETTGTQWRQQADQVVNARAQVISARSALESAIATIRNAEEAVNRANIAGGENFDQVTLAEAQIKQAAGALAAAQAQLAKTVVRTPITGEIKSLGVRLGDTLGPQTPIGEVINNTGLEVITSVTESNRLQVEIGQEVTFVNGGTGIVSSISPGINTQTGRIEVRIASDSSNLIIGDTVRISLSESSQASTNEKNIRIPLNAVRFAGNDAFVFTVGNNNELELVPVTTGTVRGTAIDIISGIDTSSIILTDARGRRAGQNVTVQN